MLKLSWKPILAAVQSGRHPGGGRKGSALLLVLVLGALLVSLGFVAMRGIAQSMRSSKLFLDEVRVEELGRSGIDLALTEISGLPDAARSRGSFAVTLATGSVTVDYVSESARADINRATPQLLTILLTGTGIDYPTAARLGAEILDWHEPRSAQRLDATKDEDYVARHMALPERRPFADPVELIGVLDMSPDILARLEPLVTVCSWHDKINPLLADTAMLRSLLGGDDGRVSAFLDLRSHGFSRQVDALLSFPIDVRPFLDTYTSPGHGYRLTITAQSGALSRQFEASACPSQNSGKPFNLIYWRAI